MNNNYTKHCTVAQSVANERSCMYIATPEETLNIGLEERKKGDTIAKSRLNQISLEAEEDFLR